MVAPRDRDPAHSVSNSGLDHLRGLSNNLFDRRLREAVRLRQVLGSLQRWRGTPDQRRNARRCGDGLHDWVRSRDSQSSHHRRRTAAPGGGILSQVKSSQVKSSQVKSSQVKSSQVKSSQVISTHSLPPLLAHLSLGLEAVVTRGVKMPSTVPGKKQSAYLPEVTAKRPLDDLEAITRTQNQDAWRRARVRSLTAGGRLRADWLWPGAPPR